MLLALICHTKTLSTQMILLSAWIWCKEIIYGCMISIPYHHGVKHYSAHQYSDFPPYRDWACKFTSAVAKYFCLLATILFCIFIYTYGAGIECADLSGFSLISNPVNISHRDKKTWWHHLIRGHLSAILN